MSASGVSTLDLRTIERVLEMRDGYVLDFTDRSFEAFFREHGVKIEEPRYRAQGDSKAKRLRYFLTTVQPPLSGRVLGALLEHRLAWKSDLCDADLEAYEGIVARYGGEVREADPRSVRGAADTGEAALLGRAFHPESFARFPLDPALMHALTVRMQEAQRCIDAEAYLAAVILVGSVLEGMCLGFGSLHPERVNRAYSEIYGKAPPPFRAWKLRDWIHVLGRLGDLSPNIEKFGHALRDFRNYVHPAEQIEHRFSPDSHTARIGFHVVVAAVDDLLRAEASIRGEEPPA